MTDTALTIITDALLDIGVLADEEVPTASQAAGALRKLNNMLDAWNIEELMVYGSTAYVLPLVSGQGVYTIGPSGNLNMPRPNEITSAYIRNPSVGSTTNQSDLPLYIFNNQEWADQSFKNMTADYPYIGVWFDMTYPLISAYILPIPSSSQYQLVFWTDGIISQFSLNDPVNLAPGYKRAVTSNLCIELAGSYSVQIPDSVLAIAESSKQSIRALNLQLNELQTGICTYDIRDNRYSGGLS